MVGRPSNYQVHSVIQDFIVVQTGLNFVPRGSLVFNAQTIYGIVVYTGKDTKVAFHLQQKGWKSKRIPIMDDMLDKFFLSLIYTFTLVCLVINFCDGFRNPLKWIMVLQKCIPISLILCLEVINFFITRRIMKEKPGTSFNNKVYFF